MRRRWIILPFLAILLPIRGFPASREEPSDPWAVVRGMTISCPGAGRIWGSEQMVDTMRELRTLGVNWISIHPYAVIRADGTVGGGRLGEMYQSPDWLTRPIAEAHRLGLKIMIKPHLAYWGSPFTWRGEIAFEDETRWRRFFDTYEEWITLVARLGRDADAFVVGTELDRTVYRERDWRHVIAAVRREIAAPLTYSASWDAYDRVPFWDALDAIGIQAYFPLVTHEGLPTQEELDAAWAGLARQIEGFAAARGRNVVFGELGYNDSAFAAMRPWDYTQGGEHAEEIQRRCLIAAMKAMQGSRAITGAFLWKWFPPDQTHHRRNFLTSTPSMRAVIAQYWGQEHAAHP